MDYILLNQQFCETHANHKRGKRHFGYGITADGRYVCAENTIREFPELFIRDTILPRLEMVKLRLTDFSSANAFSRN